MAVPPGAETPGAREPAELIPPTEPDVVPAAGIEAPEAPEAPELAKPARPEPAAVPEEVAPGP
jgi:hypothetical protein